MDALTKQISYPRRILRAYNNSEYTDLKITCGSSTFDVHQVVVCTACEFFKKGSQFGKEATEKCINLPEDDPEMIRRLVAYLYLGSYDPCEERYIKFIHSMKQPESIAQAAPTYHSRYHMTDGADQCACLAPNRGNLKQSMFVPQPLNKPADYAAVEKSAAALEVHNPLTIHATMYALADKYQVEGLGQLSREKFESCLHHHINSEDFVNAVQIIYGTTLESNRGLRDVVVRAFQTYFNVDISRIPGLEEKLETIDELSLLLIKSWPKKSEPPKNSSFGGFGTLNSGSSPFGFASTTAISNQGQSFGFGTRN